MRQIGVCFLIQDQKVLLLKVKYPEKEIWNGVSGWIEEGESPEEGIMREVGEEIGVEVKKEDLIRGYESLSNGVPIIVFTSKIWFGNPESKEESIKELKWFSFDKVPYELMIEDNKYWLPKLLV